MEIKFAFIIIIGIAFIFLFCLGYYLKKSRKREYKEGYRYGDMSVLSENAEYKKQKLIYNIATCACILSLCASILSACVLGSRLYTSTRVNEEQYNRDIMLCLDISTSVDKLNMNLLGELKEIVKELRGERMGIIIFNTSPVLISPLTDDYAYIIEQLDDIEEALKERIRYDKTGNWHKDSYEKLLYLEEGTLIANELRGSSLIGDGLASTTYNFSEGDDDRSRVVILATDNEPYGDCYFSLQEAADLCTKNNIIVYGIGTKEMKASDMVDMKKAVTSTGGRFFLEEESGTSAEIIEEISKLSAGRTFGRSYVKETDMPKGPFVCLMFSMIFLFGSLWVLRR